MTAPMGQLKTGARGSQNASRGEPLPEPPEPEPPQALPANRQLVVVTWLWRDPRCRTRYTAEHVNTWARMVGRNLSVPHRLVCLTDDPDGIECATAPIPDDLAGVATNAWPSRMGYPQCYRRLALWRRDIAQMVGGDRILSLDLDVCVRGSLDAMAQRPEPVVLAPGTGPRRPYNGSALLLDAGVRPDVFEEATQEALGYASQRYLGSDQAWITHKLGPRMPVFGGQEGVRHYDARLHHQLRRGTRLGESPRLVFFTGQAKPWHLSHPDIAEHYL